MQHDRLDIFYEKYLKDFNPVRPFTWRLRLSYERFRELEELVDFAAGKTLLYDSTVGCRSAIIYLAEWYKWRYRPGGKSVRHFNPTGEQIRQSLISAGINVERWVAVNPESGRHSWLYSVYVLGGLPVAHEINRTADSRFLRSLCRLYHGGTLQPGDEIDGSGRAEAFRMSLREGGSIYEFIREIVNGGKPFAEEDLADSNSPASQLICRIVNANNEVRRDKFRLEWLVSAPMGANHFSRRLRLNLLPEIMGEGFNQYLMYDRMLLWGFNNPASLRWIEVGVRFLNGDKVLADIPSLISYTNTFNSEQGFLSWGVDQNVTVRDVPTGDFESVEIYATADNGEMVSAQKESVGSCSQLYRTYTPGEWSDTTASQRETAVLWSEPWRPTAPIPEGLNERRPFRSRKEGVGSRMWNLTLVPESLRLRCADGEEYTFFNHQGYDRLTARLYHNIIRYEDGDKVRLCRTDDYGVEEEYMLPLIFGGDDIIIVRSGLDEEENEVEKEALEWKSGNRYLEWTEANAPDPGVVKVRVACRGRYLVKEFLLMPGMIRREIDNRTIIYPDGQWLDNPDLSNRPLNPVHQIKVNFGEDYALIDVWRPLKIKETIIGNRCYARTEAPKVSIPAMITHKSEVAVFSDEGYQRYLCYPLQSIYQQDRVVKQGMLILGSSIKANALDLLAPIELEVVMAFKEDSESGKWLFWDYTPENLPQPASFDSDTPPLTILFQDYSAEKNPVHIYCPRRGSRNAFQYRKLKSRISLLDCFLTASRYKQYFFAFLPLEELNKENRDKEIYEPLLAMRNGNLTDNDKAELARMDIELFGQFIIHNS